MHTIEIPEKKLKINVPEDLGECNDVQYINMCQLLFKYDNDQITWTEFKTHSIYYLMNMVPKNKSLGEDLDTLKYANISMLAELVESFFEVNDEGQKVIKQYYINNPIYKIRGAFKNYYGTSDEFNNVKSGEYVDALGHFADFNETHDINYLYLLLATFYREKESWFSRLFKPFSTDKRIAYNAERVPELAKTFKYQPIGLVYGFYLLFASFQKYLGSAKIYVQGNEIDLSILFNNAEETTESELPGLNFKSILYTISESGTFGSLKEVEKIPLWELIIRMYDIRKRDLDAQANLKSQTNATN